MTRATSIKHEFADFIPEDLERGTLYVSIRFATATHLCCCGCGNRVVTPIRPTDWKLIFDGKTISLDPSVGNWSFPCQSHYWIRNNRVDWAPQWSRQRIERGRQSDQHAKQDYFGATLTSAEAGIKETNATRSKLTLWQAVKKWWQS